MNTEQPLRTVKLELLPWERDVLMKWKCTCDVYEKLEQLVNSDQLETITVSRVDINWLASDFTHDIVKQGCRDQDAIELSQRLDFIERTGDGRIDSWY